MNSTRTAFWRLAFVAGMIGFGMARADAAEPVKAASASQALSVGPLLMAEASGLFGKAGVDINWRYLPNQGPTLAALMSGDIDVAVIGCQSVFDINLAGQNLQVISGLSTAISMLVLRTDVADKLGVRADAPVHERIRALKGLRIATSPVATTNYAYLSAYLAAAGLDPKKDVSILPAPEPAALLAGIRAGRFDGAAYGPGAMEPLLADKSGTLWISLARNDVPELKDTLFMCAAAKKSFVDARPDAVKGIQQALTDAAHMMKTKATAEESRRKVQAKFFAAMDPTLFEISYDAAVLGYLESKIPEAGYNRLMQIQSSVTGKDYASVEFAKTVAPGAQTK